MGFTPLRLALLVALAAVALAAGACGGDGAGEEAVRDTLSRIALSLEDVPSDMEKTDENFTTNEDVAGGGGDEAGAKLADLERWGRILGYDVTYQPLQPADSAIVAVRSSASLYRAAAGASQSFADAVAEARGTDWASRHQGFENLTVTEIERPDLADEVLWLRISGTSGAGDGLRTLIDDIVLVREERARALVRVAVAAVGSQGEEFRLKETSDLVSIPVARIRSALGGQE